MAGRGNRFFQEKYRVPKPFVPVRDRPMFLAAARSFPAADHTIFLIQAEHLHKYPVAETVARYYPYHTLIPVDGMTEGQACTCLLAESHLPPQAGLFIASCDYEMVYDRPAYEALWARPDIDVIIWTFKIGAIKKADPDAFAYCRMEGNRVVEVVEKRTISHRPWDDPAVVGSFTYRTAGLFVRGAQEMIARNIRVNGEFYVGTSINQLIEAGCHVVTFEIDKFISFGNPHELMHFEYWEEYFDSLPDHPYTMDYGHKRVP
jgi:dTDP-glucose pyrophosphorylase